MRRPLPSLLGALLLALAGCPSSNSNTPVDCSATSQKQSVQELMNAWYLYPDLIQQVSPSDPAYATVGDYLQAMTAPARAQGVDRYWTYATSLSSSQAYYGAGTSVGFGYQQIVRPAQAGNLLFVAQVFPNTAAFEQGFARGDQILAIGETEQTLVDVPTQLTLEEVAAWAGNAVGPATVGLTRSYRVLTQRGDTVVRTMTKGTYTLQPVAETTGVIPGTNVGYVGLRTFISTAEPALATVFRSFKEARVQDVIVDLRYNGGGLISTAEVLSNLLGGDRSRGDVMYGLENNPAQAAAHDAQTFFGPPLEAVAPLRLAFIMTGASASASELVANVLEPYHEQNGIAIVGEKSYGKPVGQRGFAMSACDLAVYVISFRLVNTQGEGGYYQGLPDQPDGTGAFAGLLCPAPDDLTSLPGDAAEASTAAALTWISTGACPPPAVAAKAAGRQAAALAAGPDAYPEAIAPDEAQRHVRGLF